ncbi:2Fe-2S iron-sulfur cluster binding domain-containing protein [Ketobacter sp. MCCC 1A13808]|jgi:2Fe-2S ferredoxin|uniref:2Fe-2S iron-sulfur cluster-binding protein n=1 Tax=Ketobacter sp. MCCC 1A13808 TaxID=2602738 RepID=UPI000F25E4BB|nr:2Fe-2S iron-sulfur cluster-binding protein [Ketobacter sp. MCCC 1A13808]MVF13494.1 2Fe-2S iron-sulfur cluster binding domain-containing protein [Ketobacter sp. MCCC 1A13808]RLP52302.1 MAG: 2Fe-2S ferredoxin [Ketobacter sp.]
MSAVKITFVEISGTEKVIENVEVGDNMMQIAQANGVEGILGECGGGCACGTCHIYVDPQWQEAVGEASEVEDMTLDMVYETRKPNSRLCCQIDVSADMDGLRVMVAPETL